MLERPVLIFGATGQVGRALSTLLGARAVVLGVDQADFTQPKTLASVLDRFQPSAVINAAAHTQVDLAEKESEPAHWINGESPGVIAQWCANRDLPFVHYSTDYVFPGTGSKPWTEQDGVEPLSVYGKTKLEGEKLVTAAGGKYLIFRTSWVYDAVGKNFVNTMLRLGKEREELKVVSDQRGAPTYAPDLAKATLDALDHVKGKEFPSGIYHLCNSGETSWYEFAQAIFSIARDRGFPLKVRKVEPILTSAYPTPARRPLNSRLSTEKARRLLEVELPDWHDGLKRCMELIQK